jgi:hypothetical protein
MWTAKLKTVCFKMLQDLYYLCQTGKSAIRHDGRGEALGQVIFFFFFFITLEPRVE